MMVMVTDGLKAVPFNRFSSAWVGLRPISANLTWRLPKSEKTLVFGFPSQHKAVILRACDFFDLACSSWPESLEEHLPTGIAGVLRLRA